jgi:hypothetical protein
MTLQKVGFPMSRNFLFRAVAGFILCLLSVALIPAADRNEQLWEAARRGDAKAVERLIAQGVGVDAKTHYGASALWLAASKGHGDVVKILLKHKADPNNMDIVWGSTPMAWAIAARKVDMVKMLLEAGADPDASFMDAFATGDPKMIRAVLASARVKPETLGAALFFTPKDKTEITKVLTEAGARPLPAASPGQLKEWKVYEGEYETHNGMKLTVTVRDGQMTTNSAYGDQFVLKSVRPDVFRALGYKHIGILFNRDNAQVVRATRRRAGYELPFERPPSRRSGDTLRQPVLRKTWAWSLRHGRGLLFGVWKPLGLPTASILPSTGTCARAATSAGRRRFLDWDTPAQWFGGSGCS